MIILKSVDKLFYLGLVTSYRNNIKHYDTIKYYDNVNIKNTVVIKIIYVNINLYQNKLNMLYIIMPSIILML